MRLKNHTFSCFSVITGAGEDVWRMVRWLSQLNCDRHFFLHRLTVSEAWKNGEFSLENRAGRAACRSERCEK